MSPFLTVLRMKRSGFCFLTCRPLSPLLFSRLSYRFTNGSSGMGRIAVSWMATYEFLLFASTVWVETVGGHDRNATKRFDLRSSLPQQMDWRKRRLSKRTAQDYRNEWLYPRPLQTERAGHGQYRRRSWFPTPRIGVRRFLSLGLSGDDVCGRCRQRQYIDRGGDGGAQGGDGAQGMCEERNFKGVTGDPVDQGIA